MTTAAHPLALLAVAQVRNREKRRALAAQDAAKPQDVLAWSEAHHYLPETAEPIRLAPFQKAVLRYALQRTAGGFLRWRTVIWSQVKKSGKTQVSGAVGQFAAETWGRYQEVLYVGNDAAQAKERGFAAFKQSVELTPGYDRKRRELPGKWRVLDDHMINLTNGSHVRAVATDYAGEAGSNPSITLWTELWGMIHRDATRFWAEMAPSPTRQNSMRWVETYAGYEGESELLWALYESTVLNGRQLQVRDLEAMFTPEELAALLQDGPLFAESPDPDDFVPCYVNDAAGTFAFWDSGLAARRMPWQQGERGAAYYANEAATQTPNQMLRLHENLWVSAESAFVPIEWWDACYNPLPLVPGERTKLVLSLDAAVTGDCFAFTATSRDPDRPKDAVALRLSRKWDPPKGGAIDFREPEALVRQICKEYNVAEVCYDPYQLSDFAARLSADRVAWFRPFPQGQDRLRADKGFYDLIRDRRIRHDGNAEMREHISNANAKLQKDADSTLRIVKKSESRKIDLAVAESMGASECLRLNL